MKVDIPRWEEIKSLHETDPDQRAYSLLKYYSSFFRCLYLKRLDYALKLMEHSKFDKMLDIGFGSGVLLKELSRRSHELYGIDLHDNISQVKRMSFLKDCHPLLCRADVNNLPFETGEFDCILSLSTFEFIEDIGRAFEEINRVLKSHGIVIIGIPVLNYMTSAMYCAIGLKNHRELHKSDHKRILHESNKFFSFEKLEKIPFFLPLNHSLFAIWRGRKRD